MIKKLVPLSIKSRVKMGSEAKKIVNQIKEIEKKAVSDIYILGSPIHTNLGDHLITLAEFEYLSEVAPNKNVSEIPTEMFQVYKRRLKKAIPSTALIVINGGGWMGNLWPTEELLLQEMIKTFSNNRVIVFPQTIYFDVKKKPNKELVISANKIFTYCKDVVLYVRDRQSYDFAINNYNNVKIYLVPDIALAYAKKAPVNSGNKNIVGYCFRNDRELFRNDEDEIHLRQIFEKRGYKSISISTMSPKRISTTERVTAVYKGLSSFANCSVVVTDRLHGMIFSHITKTPCIVFDNQTRKVSGVYNEWLKDIDTIYPIFEHSDLKGVNEFISNICCDDSNGNKYFDIEKFNAIKEKLNGKN